MPTPPASIARGNGHDVSSKTPVRKLAWILGCHLSDIDADPILRQLVNGGRNIWHCWGYPGPAAPRAIILLIQHPSVIGTAAAPLCDWVSMSSESASPVTASLNSTICGNSGRTTPGWSA